MTIKKFARRRACAIIGFRFILKVAGSRPASGRAKDSNLGPDELILINGRIFYFSLLAIPSLACGASRKQTITVGCASAGRPALVQSIDDGSFIYKVARAAYLCEIKVRLVFHLEAKKGSRQLPLLEVGQVNCFARSETVAVGRELRPADGLAEEQQ